MSKIFITSATGFIGEAVAQAFKSKGHEVTALARSEQSAARAKQNGFNVIQGDITQPQTYVNKLKDFDVVIHTAAAVDANFGKTEKATVDAVIEALQNTNKAFIYTSGIWVLGNTGDVIADETTPTNPIDLVAWRAELEKEIRQASAKGVRTIVIRPTIVYGHNKGIFGLLIDDARKNGEARYVGEAKTRWSTVHVDDLADLYVLAAAKAKAGSLYHAAEPRATRAADFSKYVADAAGVPGKTKSLTLAQAQEVFGPYADGLALDQQIDAGKAKEDLGWSPRQRNLAEELKQSSKELATSAKK